MQQPENDRALTLVTAGHGVLQRNEPGLETWDVERKSCRSFVILLPWDLAKYFDYWFWMVLGCFLWFGLCIPLLIFRWDCVSTKSVRLEHLLDSHAVCLLVEFEIFPEAKVALHPKLTQDFLDRVEAKLIRLNQGSQAAKVEAALAEHLESLTSITGLRALIGEPQQVAPKVRVSGRFLLAKEGETLLEEGTVVTWFCLRFGSFISKGLTTT